MSDFPGFKIKRNKRKYLTKKQRRFAVVKTVASVLGFCVLFFFGYSIAEPVMSFLNGDMRKRVDAAYSSSQTASQAPSSQPEESSSVAPTQGLSFSDIRAAFMPHDVFINDDRFNEFIAQAGSVGINTAVIELKDESGILYYSSSVSLANEIGAVVEDAPKLSDRIAALSAAGIQTIARISTFEDPLAARKIKGSAARYSKDVTSVWLDNFETEGGKPWLNPESDEGVSYITSIVEELAKSGASYVMADTLHYPKGKGLNLAYFGPKSSDSRRNVLNGVIAGLESALASTQTKLIVSYAAQDYLTKDALVYGGAPSKLNAAIIAPKILPESFPQDITIGTTSISGPAQMPYQLTLSFAESLQEDIPSETQVLPFVSYTDEGTHAEQIKALNECSIPQSILYATDGRY